MINRRVVVDTREQRPYSFADSVRTKLYAGDYSLEGLEHCFAIERKSLQDWIRTIICERRRFCRELHTLQSYSYAAVVIEASIADILSGDYQSKIAPEALLGITTGIMMAYKPVQVIFAGDRPHAYAIVTEMLKLGGEKIGGSVRDSQSRN